MCTYFIIFYMVVEILCFFVFSISDERRKKIKKENTIKFQINMDLFLF
jgi:hypothetical protein